MADERYRAQLLRTRFTPGGLALAGAGIAWHSPTTTGWLITGGLGLTGAALEAWRTWLAHQYVAAELRYADQADCRRSELERVSLLLGDQRSAREHELAVLTHAMNDAHRAARLEKVAGDEVTELARIEEAQDLWSTPVPERTASLTIDLREEPKVPPARRPRGPDRRPEP
ncbi:hypothetical protein KIH74_10590 [Kineosporia sp. J2-2]|uniref:SMODS and SLOG-associating 2TM effector domain-containing protein n=1 Tax=Kineosporia corallincola TaxID=2835133 RepID=A0ABS5TE64_9ACTN|nr:hypothetical protein [Kineosporia corallincola]MBT0769368.1 hypothetical protein [Kineosporia corallincola]